MMFALPADVFRPKLAMDLRFTPGSHARWACAPVLRISLFALLCAAVARGVVSAQVGATAGLRAEAARAEASGKNDVAVTLYSKALAEDPAWSEGWWRYGGLLYGQERFQEADTAYTHLTQLAPENPLALAMLGMSEYELQDWNNASLHLNKALAHGGMPEGIANEAMYHFGLTLMRERNRSGALIAFRLLQHTSPDFPNLVTALGSAELGLEQMPQADAETAGAVQLAGQAALAVLKLQGSEAERLYGELIQRYPKLPYAHLCMGLFLQNLGRQAEAEQQLKAETAISPSTPDAWIWLGRLALARRSAAETREYADHALQLSPNDGVCWLLTGRSYILDEQWNKALEDLQKAEALAPDSYEVHHALITVYDALHDTSGSAAERKLFAQTFAMTQSRELNGR
jgi:tetratricopeptide (TPR) repeat protein